MKFTLVDQLDIKTGTAVAELMARAPNAHYRQHPGWPRVQSLGAQPQHLVGERDGQVAFAALVSFRSLPVLGPVRAEVFRGPVAEDPQALLDGVAELRGRLAARGGPAALCVDPYWSGDGSDLVTKGLDQLGFEPMADPPLHVTSLEVPVSTDPAAMLATYKPSMRRQVRKAVQSELELREDLDDDAVGRFHQLYQEMVAQKGAAPRSLQFLMGLRDLFREWPQAGFVLSSWADQELLGAITVFTLGDRAVYAFGSTSNERPELPKSHLLHHEAMLRAAARGCRVYDLGGFSEGIGEHGNRTSTQKINYFKSGFGGEPVDFVAGHETIFRPATYRAAQLAYRLRR